MARSRTQGPTAVCRGEVQLPSSLVGDFEMQGSSTLYSAYQGHKPFQIKEHGGMEEKKSIVPNFLKYAINLTKTKRYFIPGAPFQIMASAGDITVGNDVSQEIAIKCHDSKQAYLHIGVTNALLYTGDIIDVTLSPFSRADISDVNYFYYMVLNKGKVLLFDRVRKTVNTSFPVTITDEMVPYFRIVSYYFVNINGNKSIISDSVRVEVEDLCSSKFQVQPALYTDNDQQRLLLSVFSNQVSDVFVRAVDTQLYGPKRDTSMYHQAFYWKDYYDFGSSYGGGQNSVKVFEDAGLRLISDLMESTEISETTSIPWQRGPLTVSRSGIETAETHNIVHPTYEHTWMWQIENASGQKTYRLTSDINPPQFWEISAFRITEDSEVCIAKPLIMRIDDSI